MTHEITIVELEPQGALVVRGHVHPSGIPGFLGSAFGEVMSALADRPPAGPPFARYDVADGDFEIEAGFPVAVAAVGAGRVEAIQLPGGHVATLLHRGSYESIAAEYEAIQEWFAANGYVPAGPPWESYLDGPEVAEPRTVVNWPCRKA